MRTIDILLKDLSQILRDKKSFLFLLAMPIVFTLFMGLAFKSAATPTDPRLPVGWVDADGGRAAQALKGMLSSSDSLRLVELQAGSEQAARQQVADGKLGAALLIPAGFSQGVLGGQAPQVILVADTTKTSGQQALELVRAPVTRLMSSAEIAGMVNAGLPGGNQGLAETQASFDEATRQWSQAAQAGPQIVMQAAQASSSSAFDTKGNPFNQSSPGIMVMFAVFSLVTAATIVVQERKQGTLARMQTTSIRRAEIIAGHFLAIFVLIFAQEAILVIFGQLALKVNYLAQPAGTLLVMAGLGLWVAALGLLFGVISKNEQQVTLFSLIAMFGLSALGGAWFPLEGAGKTFTMIGRLTPTAWSMTGFQNLLIRGLDSSSTLIPALIGVGYAALFLCLALLKFRQSE